MSRRSRAHVGDYELTEDGSYRYTGSFWRWAHPKERPSVLRLAWALMGMATACVLGAGFVHAPGTTGVPYVLLPYVGAVIAGSLSLVALAALTREGPRLRDYVYERSAAALVPRLTVACIASIACGMGALAHAAVSAQLGLPALLFAVPMVGAGLAFGQLAARLRRVGFEHEG